MVGRGADEVEAEGDVDAAVEVEGLDRDQRLVVVHADRGVVAGARRGVEERVGGVRAGEGEAFGAEAGDDRCDDLELLAAHGAAFAGVGVEAGDGDAGGGEAEVGPQAGVGDAEGRLEEVRGQGAGNVGERDVDGDRHHAQHRRGEHHHREGRAGEVREEFGVAGEGEAGPVLQGLLVDRVGAEGDRGAAADEIDATGDDGDDGFGVGGIGMAWFGRAGQGMRQDRQGVGRGGGLVRRSDRVKGNAEARGERRELDRVGDQEERQAAAEGGPGLERDLAADAGGVAEGQGDRRAHRSTIRASPSSSWR